MRVPLVRAACVALGLLLLGAAVACSGTAASASGGAEAAPTSCAVAPQPSSSFQLPSDKGLDYGTPRAPDGEYLGLTWLRSDLGSADNWPLAEKGLEGDLPYIQQQHLGQVLRVFVGLDQIMVWKGQQFVRLDPQGLDNFNTALQLFHQYGFRIIVVVYDQEDQSDPGNFRYWALDGSHPQMRAGYLEAAQQFVSRFAGNSTIAAWDLFNEPYNSLSPDGGLPKPPHADPVSPGYSEAVVHQWMRDLYNTAKCAAPEAWFTFSDATALQGNHPQTSLYSDCVDYYDIHIYESQPTVENWKETLGKPFILGEVGSPRVGANYTINTSLNAKVVAYWLANGPAAGAQAVLVQDEKGIVYTPGHTALTPTGVELAGAS